MFQLARKSYLSGILPLLGALMLSGCDSASTKITERDPIEVDRGGHDHHAHHGRLLISERNQPKVYMLDLEEEGVIDSWDTEGVPNALYPSPSRRYGFIVQRDNDLVNIVDGGLWQENHGDHMHDYQRPPSLLDLTITDVYPVHFTWTDTQTVIFFDGLGNTTGGTISPAKVGVFNESAFGTSTGAAYFDYETHMHGAAQARGEYLLSTLRNPEDTSTTLPDRVALFHLHDDHYDQEQIFEEPCPRLHGSAQNHDYIAFGCADGVLLIEQSGDTFAARKLPNSDAFTGDIRIGTLVGDDHLDIFVGIASGRLFEVDPEADSLTPIFWTDDDAIMQGYGFADHGELFVILDNRGRLTVLDVESGWSQLVQFQVTTSNPSEMPQGSRYELALTPGDHLYVADPITRQVQVVDLHEFEVDDTINLNFVPHRMIWLGIAEPSDDHHDHD